ncbi:putative disease resistance protein RGA3 [Carex rostrata]
MGAAASMIYSGAVEEVGGMIVSGAFSSVMSRYETQEGLDVILYSLKHEVNKIKSAITIARGRRITNQQLLDWLADIINAAYRGEYYYRTFKNWSSLPPMLAGTEGTGNLLIDPISRPAKRQRTIRTFLFNNDKHRELHDALKMVNSIDMNAFLLMVNVLPERPMKRYLYMEPTRLVNRCKEKEEVMKFLFQPSMAGENNVDILPIVGSDGVGKTTLALHCFYDPKVQNQFSLKIYTQFSQIDYSGDKLSSPPLILQIILKELTNTWITNFDEKTLLAMLKQNLSSERLLLVMDDVQFVDSEIWNALLGCLRCAKQGSKVIFISGSWSYAEYKSIRAVGTVKPIMMEGFSEDEYMLFFKEHAFGSADAEDHPELAKMGEEIAKKVNGSIWGAKILGEILRDNLNAPFWSIFLRDGFLRALFPYSKGIGPVIETISQLLPKRLRMVGYSIWQSTSYGESGVLHRSFRELMVLSPKYCTPVINEGKNHEVDFLVTKHFNLHESLVFYAMCELAGDESDLVQKKTRETLSKKST